MIGYVEYRPGGKEVQDAFNRADKAMYGKKRETKKEDVENPV